MPQSVGIDNPIINTPFAEPERSYAAEPRRIDTPQGAVDLVAFPVEYAEVYAVPFSFIPAHGAAVDPKPGPIPTHVRALPERAACEIKFPRIEGYRYELPAERLEATFTDESVKELSTADIPNRVENAPIVGDTSVHTLDELREKYRPQQVAFHIARRLLQHKFRDGEANEKPWLFPDLLAITKRWLNECLECKPGTFPQLPIFAENCQDAAERIYRAIVQADSGPKRLLPIPKPYDPIPRGTLRSIPRGPRTAPIPRNATSRTLSPIPSRGSKSWPKLSNQCPKWCDMSVMIT
jgi:type III restriction enzyme